MFYIKFLFQNFVYKFFLELFELVPNDPASQNVKGHMLFSVLSKWQSICSWYYLNGPLCFESTVIFGIFTSSLDFKHLQVKTVKFSCYSANTTIPHPIKQHINECFRDNGSYSNRKRITLSEPRDVYVEEFKLSSKRLQRQWKCLRQKYKHKYCGKRILVDEKHFALLFNLLFNFSWKDFSLLLVVTAWTDSWESLLIYPLLIYQPLHL